MASTTCRGCGSKSVELFLSFGKLPLGNAFLTKDQIEAEERFDLDLGFCSDCTLVQQVNPPPAANLARVYRNYRYVPVGESLRGNLRNLSTKVVKDFNLNADSLFIDIGSNDGALLSAVRDRCRVLGIEPAIEISELSRKAGVETITGFFTHELAQRVVSERGKADVVSATQVMQHISDVRQFLADAHLLLKPNGIFVVEGRYFADTVAKSSFDTVYHEMLYFFTLSAFVRLLEKVGMEVFKAELVDVYGGSLRVYAKNKENKDTALDDSVSKILAAEKALGLDRFETYTAFTKRVFDLRDEFHDLILSLRKQGRIAGYGAPSTGTTLLNFCNLGTDCLDYVVDDSPLKQGLLVPGVHIPIVNSTALRSNPPDFLIIVAWRLRAEIIPKIDEYRRKGMKVVVPLPKIEIIS